MAQRHWGSSTGSSSNRTPPLRYAVGPFFFRDALSLFWPLSRRQFLNSLAYGGFAVDSSVTENREVGLWTPGLTSRLQRVARATPDSPA